MVSAIAGTSESLDGNLRNEANSVPVRHAPERPNGVNLKHSGKTARQNSTSKQSTCYPFVLLSS